MSSSPGIIIISAPSGTGKSSVIERIIDDPRLKLKFSISATSREPRGEEKEGIHYFFVSEKQFRNYIEEDQFVEYVEVYPGRFYGTLKRERDRIHREGNNLLLDIDVKGALKVKEKYPQETLAIFLQPPSLEELRKRLTLRATDKLEVIEERLQRAGYELSLAPRFDCQIINDDLSRCVEEVRQAILKFIER